MPELRSPVPFVGREQEQARLRTAFDEATAGRGSFVTVMGEPGIGKTALCAQFLGYVTDHSGLALLGRCYEPGSFSLPYLPFVEALEPYIRSQAGQDMLSALGPYAFELARFLPALRREPALGSPPSAPVDVEMGPYRLGQAVTALLDYATATQPVVLVLDDLHDADRGTLALLQQLARRVASARLLIVGTYRHTDIDRTHPLPGTLAELRRINAFERLHLRGLSPAAVHQLVQAVAGRAIASDLADAVHQRTEGNPLFAQELSRYLAESEPTAVPSQSMLRSERSASVSAIPQGLQEVIGKRLSGLGEQCATILRSAAVIGGEFPLGTLRAVAGVSDEALSLALGQAVRGAVLEEVRVVSGGGIGYRFTHALFRDVLYGEVPAPARLRLHQQVALAIEVAQAGRIEEHAAELAEHYAHSADPTDLAKVVGYSELAARRAFDAYAYGDAIAHLERACQIQRPVSPAGVARRCDLLLLLGEVLLAAGEVQQVTQSVAVEALALAEAGDDQHRASHASRQALAALLRRDHHFGVETAEYRVWAEAADRWAAPDSLDRVYADLAQVPMAYFSDRPREAWQLLQRALRLANVEDDGEALYQAASLLLWMSWLPEHQRERQQVVEELFLHRRRDVSERTLARFLVDSFSVFLNWGQRARAEEALREARAITERTHDPYATVLALMHNANLATLDGRLEEAIRAGDALRRQSAELGFPGPGELRSFLATIRPLLYLGRVEEILTGQPESARAAATEGRSVVFGAERALCLGYLGRVEEARPYFDRLRSRWDAANSGFDMSAGVLTVYLEAATCAQDRMLVRDLSKCLAGLAPLLTEIGLTCVARHLGAAASLLGDQAAARTYSRQALAIAGRVRFRPEIALAHLQFAETLLPEHGDLSEAAGANARGAGRALSDDRAEAERHLDAAITELCAMGMQPALERALQLQERLRLLEAPVASGSQNYPDGLSVREVEVLRLIAAGKSNQAIADELVISFNTVIRHVSNVFTKIGAANRTEAASYAHRRGLV